MRKSLIIAFFTFAVSFYTLLPQASPTNNYCPFIDTFAPPSTPAFWAWKSMASLTPVPFDAQKKYRFYAEFYFNDETSSLFKHALCQYVSNETNCTPLSCPSFVLISTRTFASPLQAAPWNAILPNQPSSTLACKPADSQTNQQSPLECILTTH